MNYESLLGPWYINSYLFIDIVGTMLTEPVTFNFYVFQPQELYTVWP